MSCLSAPNRVLTARWVLVYACVLLVVSSNLLCEAKDPINEIGTYFKWLQSSDPSVFGGAVIGWKVPESIDMRVSTGLGSKSLVDELRPMTLGTSFRTNIMSEMLLGMAIVHLENSGRLPFLRRGAIPFKFLPPPYKDGKIPFVNPHFPLSVVSLETLLYHTSSLTEEGFASGSVAIPGPAKSLKEFVDKLFSSQSSMIWNVSNPGSQSTYRHSRLNTALATYILDLILAEQRVNLTTAAFIHNVFLAPLGLTQTFLADPTGAPPVPVYPKGAKEIISARAVQDIAADGVTRPKKVLIHAAYTSDFMYYTSVMDMVRLGRELFLEGGRFMSIGELIMDNPILVGKGKLLLRALGLYHFDKDEICATAHSYCSLDSVGNVIGWAVRGTYNDVALLCVSTGCAAAEISHYERPITDEEAFDPETITKLINLAMPSLHVVAGVRTPELREGGFLHPLYVFLGVFGTIIFAVSGGFVADYIIQAPRATRMLTVPDSGLPVNDFEVPPENSFRTPDTPNVYDQSHGIASPVRRLDVYD